jgi:hypothetical protein
LFSSKHEKGKVAASTLHEMDELEGVSEQFHHGEKAEDITTGLACGDE